MCEVYLDLVLCDPNAAEKEAAARADSFKAGSKAMLGAVADRLHDRQARFLAVAW
eukprot:gene191-3086_t